MKIIDFEDEKYPIKLKEIENPPKILYAEGNINILNSNCISIIGSRNCTEYGIKWCRKFVKELVKYDITIVSGMAIGIDGIAHTETLKDGGKPIAVLPCGLNNIYPKQNENLYYDIISNDGCIITEYKYEEKASSSKFLQRNRIVSGLSLGTLVVEAAYRSGTSVTANLANMQRRDVFCIPGSLDNPKSVGTNKLIKNFAKIAISPEDIIENYKFISKIQKNDKKKQTKFITKYNNICDLISNEPMSIDEIVRKSEKSAREIMSELTILEIDGKIRKVHGNKYIRGDIY